MLNRFLYCILLVSLAGCAFPGTPRTQLETGGIDYLSGGNPGFFKAGKDEWGTSQILQSGRDIPSEWWTLFESISLKKTVARALDNNADLQAAQASVRAALNNYRAFGGSVRRPQAVAVVSGSRQEANLAPAGISPGKGSVYDLWGASVEVGYDFDLFNVGRRELEALAFTAAYERYQMQALQLSLAGNVVGAAVREAALRRQLGDVQKLLALLREELELVKRQEALGAASLQDVLAKKSAVEMLEAEIPGLERTIQENRHLLTLLCGLTPDRQQELPIFDLDELGLPAAIPLTLPSMLARQRPDIVSAEALVKAAAARAGAAAGRLYPQITLSGSWGPLSNHFSDLTDLDAVVWNIGSGLTQPIFNGGTLRARQRSAAAVLDQMAAQYRSTVLGAFREVADVLRALEADARELDIRSRALETSRDALALAEKRYQTGASSYLELLSSQKDYQNARLALVPVRAKRLMDTAALFVALGGGWKQDQALSLNNGE